MRVIKICIALSVLFVHLLPGQETLSSLDTIEIKTTRIPLSVKETGRFISVLDQDFIQRQPNLSVDEILRYIPGVEVQSRNAFGAQSDISMRGSTFTQVLILVDGIRLNDPLTGHFNGYIPIPATEIQRIEVLRGPAAASFGPDAVGGVINILTKAFTQSRKESFEGEVGFNYGEESLVQSQAGVYWQNQNGLTLSLAGSINNSDGQPFEAQRIINAGDTTKLEAFNTFFDIKNITLGLALPLDRNWSLRFRTAYDYRDFAARYFYTSSPFDKSVETITNFWNHFRLENEHSNGRTILDAAYKRNTDEFIFNPAFPGNNHTTELLNFQLNHYRIQSDHFRWNIGLQADQRKIESNDRGNHQDFHIGGFVSGAFQLGDYWNLQTSFRLDQDENYGLEFSPQLNIAMAKTQYVIRSTIGRSIRAADYTERYVSNNLPNLTPGRSLGNPNLNAESSWSMEVGTDWFVLKGLRISATSFLRFSDQLIDYAPTNSNIIFNNANLSPDATYFYARNIEDVSTLGFELETYYEQLLNDATKLTTRLGYTFLETQNEDNVTSVYISNHAKHLFTANLGLEGQKFSVGINGLWKVRNGRLAPQINSELEDQYTVWHLKMKYLLNSNLGLNLQVHNLFDENYQDILGAPMPNRWLMGGFTWKWQK